MKKPILSEQKPSPRLNVSVLKILRNAGAENMDGYRKILLCDKPFYVFYKMVLLEKYFLKSFFGFKRNYSSSNAYKQLKMTNFEQK